MKINRAQHSATNHKLRTRCHDLHRDLVLRCCKVHSVFDWANTFGALVKACRYDSLDDVNLILNTAETLVETVYSTAAEHFAANQIASLVRKYPFPVVGLEKAAEERAITKFDKFESACAETNLKFSSWVKPVSEEILHRMRAYIAFVLGTSPPLVEIFNECGFGPGASIGVHGDATNFKRKLLAKSWSVTPSAYDYAKASLKHHAQILELLVDPSVAAGSDVSETFDKRFGLRTSLVDNNKIVFVPKTTLVLRPIAVEPLLNGYLQKGIDLYMRDCLKKRARVDLSDQSANSDMARDGSIPQDNPFCTVDLSSASDSIATEVVRELLPYDWFYLLDRTRSKSYSINGTSKTFNKFCSMGNGFCFPLQTLIFLSACHAVGAGVSGEDYRVYGDDIIVRQSRFEELLELLSSLGFSANSSKTFGQGPFRESCGQDYYLGVDVRPVQLDYRLDNIQAIINFHNSWYRSAICLCFSESFLAELREKVPLQFRFVAPAYARVSNQAFRVQVSDHAYLSSPHTSFSRRMWCTSWTEFVTSAIADREVRYDPREYSIAVLFTALAGGDSKAPFTYRRRTKTNIRKVAYGAATNEWLPPSAM